MTIIHTLDILAKFAPALGPLGFGLGLLWPFKRKPRILSLYDHESFWTPQRPIALADPILSSPRCPTCGGPRRIA